LIRVEEISLGPDDDKSNLPKALIRILNIKSHDLLGWEIQNRAIDSRRKNSVQLVYSIDVEVNNEELVLARLAENSSEGDKSLDLLTRHRVRKVTPFTYPISQFERVPGMLRPIVTGTGPCGLFAGLLLAKSGLCPIILERGRMVDERVADVDRFFKEGKLDATSNVQYGEGGAGTFSDGKLYTLVNDPRSRFVFEELVHAGAPPEILYDAKPHIGTDKLRGVVKNLRNTIKKLGGEFKFETALNDLRIKDSALKSVLLSSGEELPASHLVLAIGHSARDTFEMLFHKGLNLEQKALAMGVRIEHHREAIDRWQYGKQAGLPSLGAAKYKMAVHLKGGRTAYTFCMCPGGFVVAAASEPHMLVTNGMSEYNQANFNSNAALLVNVTPRDFGNPHPLAGIAFQRLWEKKAYSLGGGGYIAPVQLVGDFLANKRSENLLSVRPTYKPGVKPAHLAQCLPPFVFKNLQDALPYFEQKIKGFAHPEALLTAIESRSSSPIRIKRGDDFQSNISGIFPAGEGAGYAGGIVSSALDGLKAAEAVIKSIFS
jgi:uncharacterized FAD-dependent dehydrogenase